MRQDGLPTDREGSPRVRVVLYGLSWLAGTLVVMILVAVTIRLVADSPASRRAPSRPTSLPGWIVQLKDGPGEELQREAAEELVAQGPDAVIAALDAVANIPDKGDALVLSEPAVRALAAVGPPVVAPVAEALGSERDDLRVAAACVLRELGPEALPAVAALGESLADENRWVRWYAADALADLGPGAAPAVGALMRLAEHEDRFSRRRAVVALGRIGPAAKAAAPLLARIETEDPSSSIRRAAAVALHQVNLADLAEQAAAAASEQVRQLIRQLGEGDEFEIAAAARSLGELGPSAAAAVPALTQTLGSENKWLRVAAAEALGTIGNEATNVVPALQALLRDAEPEVQAAAGEALQKIEGRPRS